MNEDNSEQLNTNGNEKGMVFYYQKFKDYVRAHIWLQVVFAVFGFFLTIGLIVVLGMMALLLFSYISKIA